MVSTSNELISEYVFILEFIYFRGILNSMPPLIFFQLEYYRLIPITIIYAVMFVTGVIGNILVCFVIVHNKSMHSATNYYLFSLAIADLIILLLGKSFNLEIVLTSLRKKCTIYIEFESPYN